MANTISYIFGALLLLGFAGVFTGCEDSPVQPKAPTTVPSCWNSLFVDTAGNPNAFPLEAQSAPVWSNSGELVAYFSYFDSCNVRDPGIYIADSARGAFRRKILVFGAYYQWLPGDTELIVNTGFGGSGQLVHYNLNSDSVTPLGIQTQFPVFDVSNDGRYIYYEGEPEPSHPRLSIFEYDRETGVVWAIAEGASPGVSPDRTYLAYVAGPLYLFRFSDSTITEIAPRGGFLDWTPDGRSIVHSDRIGKLLITDIDGNSQEILGVHSRDGAFGPISLSSDGKRLLYQRVSDDFFLHIWETNLDGSLTKQFSQ